MCHEITSYPVKYATTNLTGNVLLLNARQCDSRDSLPDDLAGLDLIASTELVGVYALVLCSSRDIMDETAAAEIERPGRRAKEMSGALSNLGAVGTWDDSTLLIVDQFVKSAGKFWRDSPLWIGSHCPLDDNAWIFCEPELVPNSLQELDRILPEVLARQGRRGCLRDVLTTYLFLVGVHPLRDGNGRLGRFLMAYLTFGYFGSWNLACIFSCICHTRLGMKIDSFRLTRGQYQREMLFELKAAWSQATSVARWICGANRSNSMTRLDRTAYYLEVARAMSMFHNSPS